MYNKYAMDILEPRDEVLDKVEEVIEANVEVLIVKAEDIAMAEVNAATKKVVEVVNSEKAACYSWLFEFLRTFRRKTQPVLATSSEPEKKVSK